MALRIALFGRGPLASDCLERLRGAGHEVVVVYGPPDDGRPDPLVTRAEELGIPLERRRYFRKKSGEAIGRAVDEYREHDPELNVLAVVSVFIPGAITDAPERGSLCFHPSLLPRFRGGAAVNWQILLGERETGVTIFSPDEGADTGPIVVQRGGLEISDDDTAGTLFFQKLYPLGLEAIDDAVARVDSGVALPVPQDHSKATVQGLVDDSVAAIDLSRPAAEVACLVRGCDPQPGAFVRRGGEAVRLYDASLEPVHEPGAPEGTVVDVGESGIAIALAGGDLRVKRVRADKGKESAARFAERVGVRPGGRFESA